MSNDEQVCSSRNEVVPDGDHPTLSEGKALGAEGTTLSGDVSSRVDVPAARLSDGAIPRRSSRAGSLTAKGREYRMDLARANWHKNVSQDDRKFIAIMKENIHLDNEGHYVVPLPFRDTNIKLPNNT